MSTDANVSEVVKRKSRNRDEGGRANADNRIQDNRASFPVIREILNVIKDAT